MNKLRWRVKLMMLFVGILSILLIIQIHYVISYIRSQEIEKMQFIQKDIAGNIAREIDVDMFQTLGRVKELAERDIFRRMDIPAMQIALDIISEGSYRFESLSFLNSEGWFVCGTMEDFSSYTTKSYTDRPFFTVPFEEGKTYFPSPNYFIGTNLVYTSVSVPVESETGEQVGVLTARIRLNHLIETIKNYPLHEGQIVCVVDNKGTVVAHSNIDLFALEDGPLSLNYSQWPMVQAMINGEKGGSQEYKHDRGNYFGTFLVLESNGWGITAATTMKTILVKSNIVSQKILLTNLLLFAIALIITIIFSRQITAAQRKAEKVPRKSEDRFKKLSNLTFEGILIHDKGVAIDVNESLTRMLGYTREEMIGRNLIEQCVPREYHSTIKENIVKSRAKPYEVMARKKDGTLFPIELEAKDGKSKDVKFQVAAVRDITERKQAEEEKKKLQTQLIQSEKMAEIGMLTSGIAHEYNNLLQITSGHAEFAKRTQKPEDMKDALDIVIHTSYRASRIIKKLLAFSKQEPIERKTCNIAELVESVLSIIEEQLKKHNIKVVRGYKKTPNIEVYKGEMQQVFLNMVTNARDAMLPKGGKLNIGIKKVKDNVEISFTDTGIGIKEKNLGKVFKPFYTTKGVVGGDGRTQGIGLGLAVSYRIVKRHEGMIEVESKEGRGTTLTVKLPVKVEKAKERIVKKKRKLKAEKTKPMNVLVVDDEEGICRMFTKWLSAEGHKVKSTLTGEKALQQVKKEQFDVVFLDVIMPGIPSLIILEEIKKISPKTNVVMITGRMLDKEFKKGLKEKASSGFIQKPFKIEDINKCLANIEN